MSSKDDYLVLIKNWHIKASEEDYFSKFTFEYMALMAYLKTQLFSEKEIKTIKENNSKITDRDYIQLLKRNLYFKDCWIGFCSNNKNRELQKLLKSLIVFLKKEPITFDDRWWNFDGLDINLKKKEEKVGVLKNKKDYINLIEFWYSVRNNLFHAEKDPSLYKDRELVRFAFLTLNYFIENVLLKTKELEKIYPSLWEDFFFKSKKDINSFKDSDFPLVVLNRIIKRSDIIKLLNKKV